MRSFWTASLAAIGGGLVAYVIGSAVGLNGWVLTRLQRTWFLPGYQVLFPVFLTLCVLTVLVWSQRARWRLLPTVLLGMAMGELAGILSYLLSPFVGRGFSLADYLKAVTPLDRFIGVRGLSVAISSILLAWLYGGLVTAIGLLGRKWLGYTVGGDPEGASLS
jgi:hypothetical protein